MEGDTLMGEGGGGGGGSAAMQAMQAARMPEMKLEDGGEGGGGEECSDDELYGTAVRASPATTTMDLSGGDSDDELYIYFLL